MTTTRNSDDVLARTLFFSDLRTWRQSRARDRGIRAVESHHWYNLTYDRALWDSVPDDVLSAYCEVIDRRTAPRRKAAFELATRSMCLDFECSFQPSPNWTAVAPDACRKPCPPSRPLAAPTMTHDKPCLRPHSRPHSRPRFDTLRVDNANVRRDRPAPWTVSSAIKRLRWPFPPPIQPSDSDVDLELKNPPAYNPDTVESWKPAMSDSTTSVNIVFTTSVGEARQLIADLGLHLVREYGTRVGILCAATSANRICLVVDDVDLSESAVEFWTVLLRDNRFALHGCYVVKFRELRERRDQTVHRVCRELRGAVANVVYHNRLVHDTDALQRLRAELNAN